MEWRGHDAVLVRGKITIGDAYGLAEAIDSAAPGPHGLPIVLLDSSGGLVKAALDISAMLDHRPVHLVVPDGASCASACASILFVAGHWCTVEREGRLGQHTCAQNGVAVAECNEAIARHAVLNGVSPNAVAAFMSQAPPDEIVWFSREERVLRGDPAEQGEQQGSEASGAHDGRILSPVLKRVTQDQPRGRPREPR